MSNETIFFGGVWFAVCVASIHRRFPVCVCVCVYVHTTGYDTHTHPVTPMLSEPPWKSNLGKASSVLKSLPIQQPRR